MDQKIQAPIIKCTFSTIYICLIYYGILFAVPCYSETEYTTETSFCSINISYNQFSDILNELRGFTKNANINFKHWKVTEYLVLGDTNVRTKIENEFNESAFNQGPKIANDIYYKYENFDAPISTIELRLNDYARKLTISGSDRTQVNALASLIENEFNLVGCSIGSFKHRFIIYIVLGISALIVYLFTIKYFVTTERIALLLYFAFVISYMIIIYTLPWDLWFPGAAIRSDPLSFLDRHAGLLSLLGILVSILLPILVHFVKKTMTRKSSGNL